MHYVAFVHREGKHWLAEFPDAPGCQTFADSEAELRAAAKEALHGWLEAHLVSGDAPDKPRARRRAPPRHKLWQIHVEPALSTVLHLRWARQAAGLSQAELAARVGVSQQQIAKLENPDENPTLRTVARVSKALGLEMSISFASQPATARGDGPRRVA
jgi:predicted RNase H-like HicB family nuclease/DNA-binding XRE family transcriptional regulator